jgi:hypothetical protein
VNWGLGVGMLDWTLRTSWDAEDGADSELFEAGEEVVADFDRHFVDRRIGR